MICPLAAKIFAEILQTHSENSLYQDYLQNLNHTIVFKDIVPATEAWQRILDNLEIFFGQQNPENLESSEKRLLWYLNPNNLAIEVVEQNFNPKKGWSKGRVVALKRLYEHDPKLDYLTEADKKVIKTLGKYSHGWYDESSYEWHSVHSLLALVGHPCVYHMTQPELQLELVKASPELVIKQLDDQQFKIALSHYALDAKVFIEPETPSRYRVVEFPKAFVPITELLGANGIKVPATAKDNLLNIIQKASPMLPIHSELEIADLPSIVGDQIPHVQIRPQEQGLKVNLYTRPLKDQGPYLRPGQGKSPLMLFLNTGNFKVERDLDKERQNADKLIKACSYLDLNNTDNDEWIIDDPNDCLEVLADLQELEDVRLEWPQGQSLSVSKPYSFDRLSLKITQKQDWFGVSGALKLDDDTVMSFSQLLKLMEQHQGRFIPLSANKFLTLSQKLQKQLQELKALSEATSDGILIHKFGSLALKKLVDNVTDVEADQQWQQRLKTFNQADDYQPQVPKSLQAELREYQQEGYVWISRLSQWSTGACLADDMGLGKTIQALAVILEHAAKGPCLIVAPTSVCHNWFTEMQRFAPSLKSQSLGENNIRKTVIDGLKVMDVLICSYAILQQEADLLAKKSWQMVVLDEAQAIKNYTSKRFQAAIQLQAHFKLALSGTPIENNLEELWSLFRFIVPGLLGSRESFYKKFIEKISDKKQTLKSLTQMFMLRRTKNAVLAELPARIEQTVMIEPTQEEIAFYEALRRQALTNLEKIEGQRKIYILAEITKLRRACCHPSLVNPEISLQASKLKVFNELVDELLANKHQAFVFSQFVGYLTIVRQELDSKGISYQYLDGSTPAPESARQVEAFQAGKSSLFLLSLKAGGTGLNLTAADYVIHLDPWWNPAVEDQATDRAHRIGQTRPVTVYRLITKDSIEEKILALHKDKRDLADELLEGANQNHKISEADLLKLLA